jgi:hypothetical protein
VTEPAVATERPSLYDPTGQQLTCPACERTQPAWRYKRPFLRNPRYAAMTVDVVKCPACGWLFAPLPPAAAPAARLDAR